VRELVSHDRLDLRRLQRSEKAAADDDRRPSRVTTRRKGIRDDGLDDGDGRFRRIRERGEPLDQSVQLRPLRRGQRPCPRGAKRRTVESRILRYEEGEDDRVGAVMIPALVGLDGLSDPWAGLMRAATWLVSLVTAASAAVEGFFRFGERWRNYRRTAEQLKTEGWLYFQLAGRYSVDGADHGALYGAFVKRVEEIVNSDVEVYLTEVVADRSKSGGEGA
jgi:hypothetical protein